VHAAEARGTNWSRPMANQAREASLMQLLPTPDSSDGADECANEPVLAVFSAS
jgi:hypothetical protein